LEESLGISTPGKRAPLYVVVLSSSFVSGSDIAFSTTEFLLRVFFLAIVHGIRKREENEDLEGTDDHRTVPVLATGEHVMKAAIDV